MQITNTNEVVNIDVLGSFLATAKEDPRINTAHISLYVSLIYFWQQKQYKNPVSLFRHDLIPLCKISGSATYHKSIRDLHRFGYIEYIPSFNRFEGSLVYFITNKKASTV